jgi:hypothetical protein
MKNCKRKKKNDEKAKLEVLNNNLILFEMKYFLELLRRPLPFDPTNNESLKHLVPVQTESQCLFAKKAKVSYQNRDLPCRRIDRSLGLG